MHRRSNAAGTFATGCQGYRGLNSFRMDGLGRVNLLVGKNNCGKTSILESEVGDVTIQRIERKRGKAVRIGREAIVALPERRVEVR